MCEPGGKGYNALVSISDAHAYRRVWFNYLKTDYAILSIDIFLICLLSCIGRKYNSSYVKSYNF